MPDVQQHLSSYSRLDPVHLKTEFAKKSVLITGGGHGIGVAIAKSFASAGVSEIILVGRTESKLQHTASFLEAEYTGTKIRIFKADICSKTDVQELFASLKISPDILINNAGFLAEVKDFDNADFDDWWRSFEVNLFGTALVTHSFLRHRASDASPAAIITLNTRAACGVPGPKFSSYISSKAALARWSETLAEEVPTSTARFLCVHPGAVKTDMAEKSGLAGLMPWTEPELAGNFVTWLASEEANFLNGRMVWANWDVEDLVKAKEEIISHDLYKMKFS